MQVRTNLPSLRSNLNLRQANTKLAVPMQRLSSGLRINSASDDAAGLGISEKMTSQIRGLDQASRNSNDGISLVQTAEGAMGTITEMINRIRELTVQAMNDTNVHDEQKANHESDRRRIQAEINQLLSEIDQTADRTEFNTQKLINGRWQTTQFRLDANDNFIFKDNGLGTNWSGASGDVPKELIYGNKPDFSGVSPPLFNYSGNDNNILTINGQEVELFEIFGTDGASPPGSVDLLFVDANGKLTNDGGSTPPAPPTNSQVFVDKHGNFYTMEYANATPMTDPDHLGQSIAIPRPVFINAVRDTEEKKDGNKIFFQIGANQGQNIDLSIEDVRVQSIGRLQELGTEWINAQGSVINTPTYGVLGQSGEDLENMKLLNILDECLSIVAGERSKLGALQNRLEYVIQNVDNASLNLTDARSRVQDANMALESSKYAQQNVLQQAATAMLSQANQQPYQFLQLLPQ